MTKIWSNGYPEDEIPGVQRPPAKKHFPPSKAKIRQMAKDSSEGGRFQCPRCKEHFSMTHAVWGRTSYFEGMTNYCKDCASEIPGFMKGR